MGGAKVFDNCHGITILLSFSENFLEGDSITSDQPSTLSRTGSFGRGARLGVAFDPALGPDESGSSKVD